MSVHVVSWVLEHSDAKLGERLVLLVLADHAEHDGTNAWPAVATIARQTRLSERQVQRCLRALEARGEITKTGSHRAGAQRYGTHVYAVVMAKGDILSPLDSAKGDISDIQRVTPMSPEPSLEPSLASPPLIPPATDQVIQAWSSHAPPLIAHREHYYGEVGVKRKVAKAVARYGDRDVVTAIENYAAVLASPDHRWSHRWTLVDFLSRGLDRFVPEADPLTNFRSRNGSTPKATTYSPTDEDLKVYDRNVIRYDGDGNEVTE